MRISDITITEVGQVDVSSVEGLNVFYAQWICNEHDDKDQAESESE